MAGQSGQILNTPPLPLYAKIFAQVFESSIAEDWQVRVVFQDMLVLADSDGIIDMTHESIARRTNVPIDIVTRGIAELEKPDPKSRTPDQAGRRILRIDPHRDWGWKIVNYETYRAMKEQFDRKTYTFSVAKYMRKRRNSNTLPVKQKVNESLHSKTQSNFPPSPSPSSSASPSSSQLSCRKQFA